jgi:hypothetical protein
MVEVFQNRLLRFGRIAIGSSSISNAILNELWSNVFRNAAATLNGL